MELLAAGVAMAPLLGRPFGTLLSMTGGYCHNLTELLIFLAFLYVLPILIVNSGMESVNNFLRERRNWGYRRNS